MTQILIGFLIAILSGLGIGGGGLLVIWLVLATGMEQLTAQGVNLVYFIFSSGAAMIVHLIRRRFNYRLILWLIICGSMGALIGSLLVRSADPLLVRKLFGILLLGSGIWALMKK